MAKLTNDELLRTLRTYADNGYSAVPTGMVLGITEAAVRHHVREAKARGLSVDGKASESAAKRLDRENKLLRGQIKQLLKIKDDTETVRDAVFGIASRPYAKPPAWITAKKPQGSSGIPMTMWSDWHFGENVSKKEVAGVNEFNIEIGKKRIEKLARIVVDLATTHMTRPEYPGIIVCLGGDMISGDIHLELEITNDVPVQVALLELETHLIAALTLMADTFGQVWVPCVPGNHGRGTLKPRFKGKIHTSLEWGLYHRLARHFRATGDTRIQFYIPDETDAYFSVYGHRFLLTHGDTLGVKGGDGIIGALGPILRGKFKVSNSEAQIGRDFDTIVMGHWHQYTTLPGLIVNGTLKGYDEFARLALRASYQRPTQALWFVHPEHGITAQWPIYLEPLRKAWDGKRIIGWAVDK